MIWKVGEGDPYALLGSLLRQKENVGAVLCDRPLPPPPEIARTGRGKPYFPDYPDLHFSVSHSGSLSLCALGDHPIGVDIEFVRPRSPGLPRYVLSDREYEWYESRGRDWEDFYRLWTMKEARVKCTGEGIFHRPAREVSVPLLCGREMEWEGFLFTTMAGEDQIEGDWFGAICQRPMKKK